VCVCADNAAKFQLNDTISIDIFSYFMSWFVPVIVKEFGW